MILKHFDIYPKFQFTKNICIHNIDFYRNILFIKSFDFWYKFRLLVQISIFGPNFDFWSKFQFFLSKVSNFGLNLDFSFKFRFLVKILIFGQNFDIWSKIRFSAPA